MASLEYFNTNAKLLRKSLEYVVKGDATTEDVNSWLNLSMEAIKALKNILSSSLKLRRAEKQKYQTLIMHFLSIQNKLSAFIKTGGELQKDLSSQSSSSSSSYLERLHEEEKYLVQWDDISSAFANRIKSGVITNLGHLDVTSFLDDARALFDTKVTLALEEFNALKLNAELAAEYIIEKNDSTTTEVKYHNTANACIYKTTDLQEWFDNHIKQPILREMEEFEERDSGWSLQQILYLVLNVNKLNPMQGSSFIPLPETISRKKACVNVKNEDHQCFKWAILSALYPQERNAERVNLYKPYENILDFNEIEFPVSLKQIRKFEKQNDNISINVYVLELRNKNYKIQPCLITPENKERHINLLLLQNYYIDGEDEDENKEITKDDDNLPPLVFHYVWIKSLSRLVRSQLSQSKNKHYICNRCLHFFKHEEKLQIHEIDCKAINKCKVKLPTSENNILSFKNHNRRIKVPYVIYADFECLLKSVKDDKRAFQKHQAYSIGYYVKCSFDDRQSTYRSYRQETEEDNSLTPAEWFIDNLRMLANKLSEMHHKPKPMALTVEETLKFDMATSCHICGKNFSTKDIKVRDHCHITGCYRGAAHQGCNINFIDARFIPVIFHNLSGYDSHFIIKELATATNFKGRVQLLAENKEKYISFTKYIENSDINFRFIDSYRFMASSLDKLASYLNKLDITSNVFIKEDCYTEGQIQLLLRKGVFPYDYVNSFEKLKQKELPSKYDFYSKLNDSNISDIDYEHAKNVWSKFNIETLGHYADLYLKTDVLLLADVFENFRSTCIDAYDLDPAHYYTTPGLTWDAMLKYTQVELEQLTDIDMLLFVEKGIRGGVSQCSNRYAKANNKFMSSNYNPNEEETYLMYYDANNLYGWAMTQSLPQGGFQWVHNLNNSNFFNVPDDNEIGYILEVDLEYPKNIHDNHKDLPLCPEHRIPPGSKQKKLLTTLYNKERYVIHYRALKLALKHGLVLKKIHRALRFKQSTWLKPYVDLNTEKRKQSKNEFEKMFFKLLINAVYGKTMENERKRVDIKLVNKWTGRYGAESLIAKPNFHSRSIFADDLVAIQLARLEITITKPIYVGLCVLDISKILIYDFHYSYMKQPIGDSCKLLYTDTDSLIYEIRGVNMYEIMKQDIDRFDTSDYKENNPFDLPQRNKKVIGLMKDECNGNIMTEFIGLRSKMYSIRIQNHQPIKKAKGVKTAIVKTKISFDDYKRALFDQSTVTCQQNTIRSRHHVVHTEKEEKIALSPYDDKRKLIENSTDTLPWGYCKLNEYTEDKEESQKLFEIEWTDVLENEEPSNKRVKVSTLGGGETMRWG